MSISSPLPDAEWPLERRCAVIGRFWALHWTAIQLVILREKGEADLVDFKYSILRRHQRSHFLPGLAKLGIDRSLPPAVVAARYHYFSNAIGGLPMQYIEESPRKAWIRYMPPVWTWPGAALFPVPASVQKAMFAGWHPFNGASLGCPRLRFVVTKVFQDGEPYDEGYFEECDRDLEPDERILYRPVTISPDFDPESAPRLDPVLWPKDRLVKAKRNFALGYVEDAVETALQMYGVQKATYYIAQSARLCALQFFDEFRQAFGVEGSKAADLVRVFAGLSELAGEKLTVTSPGPGRFVVRRTHKVFAAGGVGPEVYAALFNFIEMSAKVMSARIKVELSSVEIAGGPREEWTAEDVAERLF